MSLIIFEFILFCLFSERTSHIWYTMSRLSQIKKLMSYLIIGTIFITGILFFKLNFAVVTHTEFTKRTPAVPDDVAQINAILSRKYIARLEEIRRNLLKAEITTNVVHRNLSAVDASNYKYFQLFLTNHRVNDVHSIWFSESDDIIAPYMAKNYYYAIMRDCNVYRRRRPDYNSKCYSRPEDVEEPFPFSAVAKLDLVVQRYSETSGTELQHNFTYMLVVAGAIATPNGDVVKDNWKVIPSSCHPVERFHYFQPTSRPGRYREVFLLGQYRGTTFFHFIIENLPRIAAYLSFLLRHPRIQIHVRRKTGFTRHFLASLGIASSRLVSEYSQADIVYMPAGTPCGHATLFNAQLLSMQLRAGMSDPAPPRDTIVLIRRTKKRWFNHHDDIFAMIRKHADSAGLKAVVYGDNPVPGFNETRQLFSRAYIVVAPHGAGESNLIFSQPGTILVEALCYYRSGKTNFCYRHMALMLGHRYCGLMFDKQCMNITAADVEPVVKYYVDKLKA